MALILRPDTSPERALALARRRRERDPGALIVSLGRAPLRPAVELRIDVADPALRARIEAALLAALPPKGPAPPSPPVWILSTIKRARALGPRLAGALAVVRVSERNAGRLRRLVALLEAHGAAAIQLASPSPLPPAVERALFTLLEARRGQPGRAPLVLAPSVHPVEVLLRALHRQA